MDLLQPLGRWTVRTLRMLTLTAAVAGSVQAASAQAPTAPRTQSALPKCIYTKTSEFKLPIQMDEKTRASLDRVCLYVKSGNADWVRQETGSPALPYFIYRVPRDGEYWFTLTTIDKSGRMSPADVSQEPPSLRVLVDTKAPMIDVQPWTSPQGELCVRCNVIDIHPDAGSLKAVAKLPAGDRPLQPFAGQSGVFRASGPELLSAGIMISASDLSGNTSTREVRLRDLLASTVQATPSQPSTLPISPSAPTTTVSAKTNIPMTTNELPPPSVDLPAPPPLPVVPAVTLPQSPQMISPASNVMPMLDTNPRTEPSLPAVTSLRSDLDLPPRTAPAGARQIINTTRAILDYRIDQVGPSGVGKVEVFLTSDQGQTWQKIGDDADRRSPVEFDLPGEGLFGIRLAVTNGNGFGGTVPQRGDAPTCLIEVDTSAPFVQLRPIDAIIANGALDIRWQATDKNLSAEPVSLYYRSRNDGPWQVIARGVKNDGLYRWTFPRDASAQFFVKVEVTDLSGNTARAETPNPIVLDMTEPRATVVGVTGLSVRGGGQ